MKNIFCLLTATLFVSAAFAQRNAETQSQYRTDVSVKEQLKGTSMPNVQYRTAGAKSAQTSTQQVQQAPGAQIKSNAEPGKLYKKTTDKGNGASAPVAGSGHTLTSDKKAEPVKQQPAPEMPKNLTQ